MTADLEAQIVAEAIDATIDKLSAALGVPKPTVDAKAWADLALMRLRVTAWARDCVTHGDLTPAGERSLQRILGTKEEPLRADRPRAVPRGSRSRTPSDARRPIPAAWPGSGAIGTHYPASLEIRGNVT